MVRVTLRVLDGADRGRNFDSLDTPVTIGREEGNVIQLNDERVSRFHVKIQSDGDRLVLTDLESTNGTRVNGEDVRLRVLKSGDLIQLGRSLVLVGSREQIEKRLAELPSQDSKGWLWFRRNRSAEESSSESGNPWTETENLQDYLFNHETPELPDDMTPTQAAQLAELIDYLRLRIRGLIAAAKEDKSGRVTLGAVPWQKLLDVNSRLAEMVRQIGEPDSDQ
jgi:pSer/pThr/pTyr-binding forkhead associated (FHA) protein